MSSQPPLQRAAAPSTAKAAGPRPDAAHAGAQVAHPAAESQLKMALRAGRIGTWTLDLQSYAFTTSELCRENFGRDPLLPFTYEELRDAVHPEDQARMQAAVRSSIENRQEYDIEYRLLTPVGETRWVQIRAQTTYADDGTPLSMSGVSVDITERRTAELAWRESEARYRLLFDSLDEGFCVIEFLDGPDGPLSDYVHVEANRAYARHAGIPDVVGQRVRTMVPDEAEEWVRIYRNVLVTGEAVRFERELVATSRVLELAAFRLEPPSRRQVAVLFQDVTVRRRAEVALRELNETLEQRIDERSNAIRLYQDMFQSNSSPVVAFDHQFRVTAFNAAHAQYFRRVYAREAMIGDELPGLLVAEQAAVFRGFMTRALGGESFKVQARFGDPAIEQIHWEVRYNPLRDASGQIIGAFHHAVDITAQVAAEERLTAAQDQLRQSQKMEAMGQLTGGVAHDFNNLLTPIVGVLDLLSRRGLGEREQKLIGAAGQSADRARTLVQRLLAFARRQPLQAVAVDVAALIRGMADLVASTTGPQIKVAVEAPADLPSAMADPNQLEMALLNLAVNARDAMPTGGTLRITASAERITHSGTVNAGDYIRVSVADTGSGMDAATLARAIEPFFSTKGVGRGTGLGLSMVHGLTSQLGGALTIQSKPGLGTNVEVWLPRSAERPAETVTVAPVSLPARRGVVLLVDDEDLVRLSTADMLSELGYEVIEANNAEEALSLIRSPTPFDIVVTDHLMPGMTGTELARLAKAQRPAVQILLVSGYAEVEGVAPDLPRLTKPFRKDELAAGLAGL